MVLGVRGIPNVSGGVETHAEHLYPRLAVLGCDVEVIVRTPFVPKDQQTFGPIRLRRIWSPQTAGLEALVHSILGVLYAGVARPDILHIHAIGPAIVTPLARLLGLRIVVTNHGPDYARDKWGPFARWVLRTGERVGMRYSHARIVISKVIQDLVMTQCNRDSVLIPNGVLPAEPRIETDRLERYGLEPGRYFLQVSRIVPEKRQLDLIRAHALAKSSGWKLALVGGLDGTEYSRDVETLARTDGVVLTGFLKGAALEQLYTHAGAFVLPSSHEGLPIALLEALSYGLPVLASDIPANLEIGLSPASYFRLGDVECLAKHLMIFSQTPRDEPARLERRRWVEAHYNWDLIAAKTLAVYKQVVE
jgi:glycosyltransferase involved in cell wall biosynthesis